MSATMAASERTQRDVLEQVTAAAGTLVDTLAAVADVQAAVEAAETARNSDDDALRTLVSDRLVASILTDPIVDAVSPLATQATLASALTELQAIHAAVADLDGNTDGLEGKLDQLHTDLTALAGYFDGVEGLLGRLPSGGAASEATIADIKALIGTAISDDVLAILRDIKSNTASAVIDIAQLELTADQVQLNTDALEAKLDTVHADGAAILAKLITAPATEAKQDTANTSLATIAGKDFATQTTAAAILAKIIAAPATEAKQDTANTKLDTLHSDLGTLHTDLTTLAGYEDGVEALLTTIRDRLASPVLVDSSTADGVLNGDGTKNVTTAGTRVALASSTACKWVVVTARPGNTGKIVVGTVTCVAAAGSERGVVLAAGQPVALPATNLANVYIDSTVNGEGVAFAYGS